MRVFTYWTTFVDPLLKRNALCTGMREDTGVLANRLKSRTQVFPEGIRIEGRQCADLGQCNAKT
jgi:hypothetical protein